MRAVEKLTHESLTRMLEHHREQGRLEGERVEKLRCAALVRSMRLAIQDKIPVAGNALGVAEIGIVSGVHA